MGSEALEEERKTSEDYGSPSKDQEEEVTVEGEEKEKRGKKRGSPEKGGEEGTDKKVRRRRSAAGEGAATPVERPSRERKAVERYAALSLRKVSATKALSIEQGSGTKLKDIPNVVFKLSKRKVDENLQALHSLLFGRKSNVHNLKRNIFQFSGFVWSENEEKQRAKVKEKLDKCTKDKLLDFCELLDIHILRATTKKEEISAKLLEFLESPQITRDVLLADKDKGKKRRRRTKGISQAAPGEVSSDRETKKHKRSPETEVKKGRRRSAKTDQEEEDEDEGGSSGTKDASVDGEDNVDSEEESGHAESEEEDEEEKPEEPVTSKKGSDEKQTEKGADPKIKENASPVKKRSLAKSDKSISKPVSKKASLTSEDEPKVAVGSKQGSSKQSRKASKAIMKEKSAPAIKEDKKKSSRKSVPVDGIDSVPPSSSKSKKVDKKGNSNESSPPEDKKASKKKEAKSGSKVSTEEQGKGKANPGPSTKELHSVVSNILKEVDFNTATLADILKQLGAHFNMDLMDRKAEVKRIIEDVIHNMTDDEDGEEEDGTGDDEEEGNAKEEESAGDGKE